MCGLSGFISSSSLTNSSTKTLQSMAAPVIFFTLIRSYKGFGDTIAQHGTFHTYHTKESGILKINANSEFSGLPYEQQLQVLNHGKEILSREGVWSSVFMAPSHSFDMATLKCLSLLGFRSITDGYGFYPYRSNNIVFVPQLLSRPIHFFPGIQTICLHINTMSKSDVEKFCHFISRHHKNFVDYHDVVNSTYSNNYFKLVNLILGLIIRISRRIFRFLK